MCLTGLSEFYPRIIVKRDWNSNAAYSLTTIIGLVGLKPPCGCVSSDYTVLNSFPAPYVIISVLIIYK